MLKLLKLRRNKNFKTAADLYSLADREIKRGHPDLADLLHELSHRYYERAAKNENRN